MFNTAVKSGNSIDAYISNSAQNITKPLSYFSKKAIESRNLKDFIEQQIEELWPNELNKPLLCYFDKNIGPTKSDLLNYEFNINDDIKQDFITQSIDSVLEEMPFGLKSNKNNYLISYNFNIDNPNEKRGGKIICSIITKSEKKGLNIEKTEHFLEKFVEVISSDIQEYIIQGGKL
jgi:hypothetical protein